MSFNFPILPGQDRFDDRQAEIEEASPDRIRHADPSEGLQPANNIPCEVMPPPEVPVRHSGCLTLAGYAVAWAAEAFLVFVALWGIWQALHGHFPWTRP